jgi:hypothetical protein
MARKYGGYILSNNDKDLASSLAGSLSLLVLGCFKFFSKLNLIFWQLSANQPISDVRESQYL